ncbi:UNVERIFIED_CONTAM: hypothetical protein FKN15_057448 [Acipenser sinensis]
MQHTSSALGDETFCSICAASQPRIMRRRLAEFTDAASSASSAESSAALGAPPLLHLPSSLLQSIPCAQVPAHRAHSRSWSPTRSSKRARHSKQDKDISELMAQVLEYLVRQQALPPAPASAPPPAPAPEPTPSSPAVAPDVSERDEVMSQEQDAISFVASWDGDSFAQQNVQEITQEMGPSSEISSETGVTPSSSSVRALMERASNFLQVPWKAAAPEQRCPVFRPVQASTPGFSGGGTVFLALTGLAAECLQTRSPDGLLGKCRGTGPSAIPADVFYHRGPGVSPSGRRFV